MSPECYICYRLYEIIWVCLGVSSGNVVLAILIGKYREISGNYSVETLETLPFIEKHTAWRHEGRSVVSVADCFSATAWVTQSRHPGQLEGTNGLSEVKYPQRAEYSSAGSCSDFFQLLSGWWLCTNSFLGFSRQMTSRFSSWLLVTASGLVMSRRTDCNSWHSHHVHLSRAMWEKQWQRLPKHANYIKLQHGNLDMQTKRRHFCRHLLQELFWNAARTPTSPRDKIPSCRAQRPSCDCKNSSQAARPLLKELWPLPSGLNSVRFSGEWQENMLPRHSNQCHPSHCHDSVKGCIRIP